MTVEYLIERLQKFDPKAKVKLHDRRGEELLFVLALKNDNKTIWFETESDVDMGEEIQTRLDSIKDDKSNEVEIYDEMLKTGITIDMVKKYIGNEEANHMYCVCIDNNLIKL